MVVWVALSVRSLRFQNPRLHERIEQRMRPERWSQAEFDVGMTGRELVASRREVATEMHASRQEVRDHEHTVCAEIDAAIATVLDVGLGQFEKARNNDWMDTLCGDPCREFVQVIVRGLPPAAVSD
jgi:hypothetical protein